MNKVKNMNTIGKTSTLNWETFEYWALVSTMFGGVILSIISALSLCTEQCSETKSYLFFNMPFAYFGLAFFITGLFLQVYSRKYPIFRRLIAMMIAGAIGAEVMFIGIQKYQIKMWCPVCLTIASLIGLAGIILIVGSFIQQQQNRGNGMKAFKNVLKSIPIAVMGFFIAFVAISKPDYALHAMNTMKDRIELGNRQSPVEIYFVTDWFCPICKDLEPQLISFAPEVMKKAGFFFVDMDIHPETQNFSPYNIDFLVNNKGHYLEIRKALIGLSAKNKAPDDDAIRQAIAPLGEKLHELGYADIKAGIKFFEEIADKYDIHGTPEMIIVNTKTNDMRRLKGTVEITESRVNEAIDAVSK